MGARGDGCSTPPARARKEGGGEGQHILLAGVNREGGAAREDCKVVQRQGQDKGVDLYSRSPGGEEADMAIKWRGRTGRGGSTHVGEQ